MAETNPKDPGANAAAAAHGTGAAGQGTAGGSGFVSSGFEGSTKQASDINTEEALAIIQSLGPKGAQMLSDLMGLNAKRTYDQAQSFDLATKYDDVSHRGRVHLLAEQALQNAIETANMVGKQAVRHAEIAIDRQWNVDEQGYQVTEILRDEQFKQAVSAAVANAVNAAWSKSE